MEFTLKINMDNAAFDRGEGRELARLLRAVAKRVDETGAGENDGTIRDINGNKVGSWEISE